MLDLTILKLDALLKPSKVFIESNKLEAECNHAVKKSIVRTFLKQNTKLFLQFEGQQYEVVPCNHPQSKTQLK